LQRARGDGGGSRREMGQQGGQRPDDLRGVEANERIGAEDRVQRGMVFLGGLNLSLPFGRTVHFATSWFRETAP